VSSVLVSLYAVTKALSQIWDPFFARPSRPGCARGLHQALVGTSVQLKPKNVLKCCSALSICCCIFLILGESRAASLGVTTNRPRIPRARRPPCNLVQVSRSLPFHALSLPRKIIILWLRLLRHCRQHQWWNTKEIQLENCDLYAKWEELLISAASMRELRKLGKREKAFWWQSGCFKVFYSVGCYECCKFVLPLRFIPWARPVFLISCFWRHSSRVIRRVGVINKALVRCCSFAVETQSVGRPAHIVSCSSARRFGVNAWTWRFYIVHV